MTLEKSEFAGRGVAVLGVARTGLAAAPALRDLGAHVLLSDSEPDSRLGGRAVEARGLGVEVCLGANPAEALEGAEIVIPSPGIRPDAPVLRLAQERGLTILSEIEVAYRISRAPIIAVTGTNGKTTTTMMLGDMMRIGGVYTWVAGNIAADEVKQALIHAASRAQPTDVIVAEISSFQLVWVDQFRPHIGILTNVTPDHMNWHSSFTEYAACKERLFAAQSEEDVAIINAVNAPSRAIGERVRSRLFWFDRGNCAKDDSACVQQGVMVVRWNGREHRLCRVDELTVPGTHNVENGLAAAGAAIAYGIEPEAVAWALREFRGVVHRMEPVAEIGGVRFINNSMCTNVDAAVRSLEAMDRPTVLIAGGADKGSDFAPLGASIAHNAKALVVIGSAGPDIESSARAGGMSAVARADSMEEAVRIAAGMASAGDAVMLSPACASFDMYADFEARGQAFRDAVSALR